jgi:hypothetical protein
MTSTIHAPRLAGIAQGRCPTSTGSLRARAKIPLFATLLVLASALVVVGCKKTARETTGAAAEASSAASTTSAVNPANLTPDSVVVYYFHGNRRCRTCVGIQRAIQTTVADRFAAETASGTLVFREVNIDEPANAHFISEYDLSSSSMVVVAKSGETTVKWENCSQVWPLAHDEAALSSYAENRIRSYLELVRRT